MLDKCMLLISLLRVPVIATLRVCTLQFKDAYIIARAFQGILLPDIFRTFIYTKSKLRNCFLGSAIQRGTRIKKCLHIIPFDLENEVFIYLKTSRNQITPATRDYCVIRSHSC